MVTASQARNVARLLFANPRYLVHVAVERLQPVLSYYLSRSGTSAFPTTLTFFLTHKCNMRCKMCGLWGEKGTAAQLPYGANALSVPEYEEIIRKVAFCKPTITLFGGEPFLFQGWEQIAKAVKDANLRCRIVTNGLLLEKNAEKVVELGVDKVDVSIDGPAPVHDDIRGVKGAFDRAIRGIQAVNAVKKARRAAAPPISVVCTVSQANHAYLVDLAEALKDQPIIFLSYQHLTFIEQAACEDHERIFQRVFQRKSEACRGFVMTQENLDPQLLISQLHRLSHMRYPFPIFFRPNYSLREVVEYYTNPEYRRESHLHCVAPWREAYLMPDGSFMPCLDYVVGNLRTAGLRELWNNPAFCRFRSVLKKKGRFPFCQRCCN